MASFGDRPAELTRLLADAKPHLSDEEFRRITDVLSNYASARNDALGAAADILQDTGDDPKNSDYKDKLSSGKSRVAQILGGMLDGLTTPSPDAVLFRTQTLIEDSNFFSSLSAIDLGGARDQLLGFKPRLISEMSVLQASWDTTTREQQRIKDIEVRAEQEMNAALQSAIRDGVDTYAKVGQAMYTFTEKFKGIPDLVNTVCVESVRAISRVAEESGRTLKTDLTLVPDYTYADMIPKMSDAGKDLFERAKQLGIDAKVLAKLAPYLVQNPGMDFGDKLDDAMKALGEKGLGAEAGSAIGFLLKMVGECKKFTWVLGEAYVNARSTYTSQLPNEGTIMLCFSKARQDVDKFLQENGIDVAQKYFDTLKDDLNPWMSGVASPGLQSDAHNFGMLALDGLARRVSDLQSRFTDFVSSYKGKFIGEVDSSTKKVLLDMDSWDSMRDGMIGLGLDQRLKDFRSQGLTIMPGFEDVWSQIQSKVSSLPIAFQARVRDNLNAQYQSLKSELAQVQQEATAALDQPEKTCNAEEIRRVFDRSQLAQALR